MDVDERRVLLLGCSLDREALLTFCDGQGDKTGVPVETAWCFNKELNARAGYIFHPGVGENGDLHLPVAQARGLSTGSILKNYAGNSSLSMLNGNPHLVVVDSSLWDLFVWRLGTSGARDKAPPEPKPVTAGRVQQWCQHDLPLLMRRASEIFPTSRIAFRTAPTIAHTPKITIDHRSYEKFEKQEVEMLYQCIRSSTENGMLFGKYEIIDYHAIVEKLIDRDLPHLFRKDGYHPSWYPSALYFNEILRRVGLNPQDPPEWLVRENAMQSSSQDQADRKSKALVAIQGDLNNWDLS
jgi:hypothetical protein